MSALRDVALDDALGQPFDDRRLPTPGSPISTGLFFVRRERTCTTRRISSSRPMTGSSFPCCGELGEVAAVLPERLVGVASGSCDGDPLVAAHLGQRLLERRPRVAPAARSSVAAPWSLPVGEREQQVLGRDVLVLELAHRLLGGAQHSDELVRRARGLAGLAAHRRAGRRARRWPERGWRRGRRPACAGSAARCPRSARAERRAGARAPSRCCGGSPPASCAAWSASWDLIVNRSRCSLRS